VREQHADHFIRLDHHALLDRCLQDSTINHQLIVETSKTTVATAMLLASSPSRVKDLKVTRHGGGTAELVRAPSPERGVREYIVAWGPAEQPLQHRKTVREPRATVTGAAPGTRVAVKAVNARGLEGWDWARTTIGPEAPARD
jgi:hypothetical protein